MTQNSLVLPTSGLPGLTMIQDINAAHDSMARWFSGPAAPTTSGLGLSSLAGVPWHDTTTNTLKVRDQADSAWIVIGSFDETNKLFIGTAPLGPVVPLGANTTLDATYNGKTIRATAAITLTLPRANTLPNGFYFSVSAEGGAVTLAPNAADKFNALTVGASYTVAQGNSVEITGDAASAGTWVATYQQTASASSGSPSVRNTVLSGATSSGLPAFSAIGTGLSVNLLATATPLVLTAANGYGATGAIDTVTRIAADVTAAWSGLTANQPFIGLYIDTTTPASPTYGASYLVPADQATAPSSPATDQHWFDRTAGQMKRWNGSAWVAIQRVFVAEAVSGASSITSVVCYAFNRSYDSGLFSIASNGSYSRSHNIGGPCVITVTVADDAAGTNERPFHSWYFDGSSVFGFAPGATTRNSFAFFTATGGWLSVTRTAQTSGYARVRVKGF